jgi:hypothetical protein
MSRVLGDTIYLKWFRNSTASGVCEFLFSTGDSLLNAWNISKKKINL